MNIIQMQDRLKDLSDNQLRTYVEGPRNMQGSGVGQGGTSGGYIPTYLVLGEMKRRKDSRSKYQGEKAQQKTTVAEDLVAEQGIGGNQMTRNPMSQPTAGVGTPQPQEPVNPAMLSKKGIGQLDPGAVKQMNDGGIVGYAGKDGVSLVGENKPGEEVQKAQAQNRLINYESPNLGGYNTVDFLPDNPNTVYESTEPKGRYSSLAEFFRPPTETAEEQKKKDMGLETKKILDNINKEIKALEYGVTDSLTDTERFTRDERISELKNIKGNVIDKYKAGDIYKDTEETFISDVVEPDGSSEVLKEQINDITEVVPEPKPQDFQGQSGETRLTEDFINRDSNQNNDFLSPENAYESVYGKDKPIEQMSQEDFMEKLTGKDSAFAKQQKTTKEFKEDLLKRADDKIMSTDDILMNVGFNMMADKGGETNALRSLIGSGGRAALDTVKKVKAGEKEGDALRDKANQLEMNMNAVETELAKTALQYGVNSKQFAEKSRQMGLQLDVSKEISDNKIASAEKVARINKDARIGAAGIKGVNDKNAAAQAAVTKTIENLVLKNTTALSDTTRVLKMSDKEMREKKNESAIAAARSYVNQVGSVIKRYNVDNNIDPIYADLKEKLDRLDGGSSVTYQVVEQEGKKYKVGSDGSSELIN